MRGVRISPTRLVALLLVAFASSAPARAEGTLVVCLDENIPPLSSKHGKEIGGFDVAVSQAVARSLGRTLQVQWFESKVDNDSNPAAQANALLSDGRCDLVAGYPLFAGALGEPRAERSKLPDYEGARPEDRRRWVRLNKLMASRGYRFDPFVVVLGPKLAGRQIRSLSDLKDVRLGVEEGTLADAILMTYAANALADRVTHVVPGPGLFEGLEKGDYDATLVELHHLDAYRSGHPETQLSSSGHYHSIGFNVGFAGLATEAPLIAEVNAAIGEMLAKGGLPALAQAAGATYVAPRQPEVLTTISGTDLRGD
ncbi:MAG: transporter substrate-binding domain-containing protein [Acetobacteraceae bacterium]|nr:transporter substrate-binding domain-containing protein [Acetobacteraceae bacterium]